MTSVGRAPFKTRRAGAGIHSAIIPAQSGEGLSVNEFISNGRHTVNVNKQMDDCKRGFVGVSANFAVTAVLLPNTADFRFRPLHPTPLALMPHCRHAPRWFYVVEESIRDQVEERGDAEHLGQCCA